MMLRVPKNDAGGWRERVIAPLGREIINARVDVSVRRSVAVDDAARVLDDRSHDLLASSGEPASHAVIGDSLGILDDIVTLAGCFGSHAASCQHRNPHRKKSLHRFDTVSERTAAQGEIAL